MENYHFNKTYAKLLGHFNLFGGLLILIEIQRNANLYRAGAKNRLTPFGICANFDNIRRTIDDLTARPYMDLSRLFFDEEPYPIKPYHLYPSRPDKEYKNHLWGDGVVGNKRMEMLERMIIDLTNYLQTEA